ncbi:hypothetical protein O9929_17665 [Vibrio lentus]|nr:hypothetical protein [Vibrio lentus]
MPRFLRCYLLTTRPKRSEDIVRVASIIEVAELSIELSDIKLAIKQQNKAELHYTPTQKLM